MSVCEEVPIADAVCGSDGPPIGAFAARRQLNMITRQPTRR